MTEGQTTTEREVEQAKLAEHAERFDDMAKVALYK